MFGAFIIFGGSDMDAGRCIDESWRFQCTCTVVFSTRRSEQTIMMSLYGIMRISHAIEGGKRRALQNLGSPAII